MNTARAASKALINHAGFQELAERLVEDEKSTGVLFQGGPQTQVKTHCVIKIVAKEWLDNLYINETRKVRIQPVLEAKAHEKPRKRPHRTRLCMLKAEGYFDRYWGDNRKGAFFVLQAPCSDERL